MLRNLVLCLAVSFGTAAHANFLTSLFGGNDLPTCEPRDKACIVEMGVANTLKAFAARDNDFTIERFGRELAALSHTTTPEQAAAIRSKAEDADDKGLLIPELDKELAKQAPRPQIPLEHLARVLGGEPAPSGRAFDNFVYEAFLQATQRGEAEPAIQLWYSHSDLIWDEAKIAWIYLTEWMAEHDVPAFEDYTTRFYLSGAHRQQTWEALTYIAYQHCARGDIAAGDRLLEALEDQYRGRSPRDPVIQLYARAEFSAAILACHGEAPLLAHLDEIDALKTNAYAFIREKYTDEGEQNFVLQAAHDTVELDTTRQYAVWLYLQDRKDDARRVFEDGQATAGVWGVSSGDDGGIRSLGREPMPWSTFEADVIYTFLYGPAGAMGLEYFLTNYEPDLSKGYETASQLTQWMTHVQADWPSDLSLQAAQRMQSLARKAGRAGDGQIYLPDWARLTLASLPQPARCDLGDEALSGILERIPGYAFAGQRHEVIMLYLAYLDRPIADGLADCALP